MGHRRSRRRTPERHGADLPRPRLPTDNAELALGSALAPTGLGEAACSELVGFRVISGYGVPADCGCGPAWTDAAPQALEEGSSPLVPDPKGERASVLTCAVDALTAPDETEPMAAKAEPASEAFALPKRP